MQWEDSDIFESEYLIKYISRSNGQEITFNEYNESDRSNTCIAAFIGCTYHCG